jgi:hypothetical protein
MSRITMTYKLPEEQEEYNITRQAGAMHSVIWELQNGKLRSIVKHGIDKFELDKILKGCKNREEVVIATVDHIREYIFELTSGYNIET